MSDSSRPHGLQPTRLLHPWDFPGKSTGVGCHCLLQVNYARENKIFENHKEHTFPNLLLWRVLWIKSEKAMAPHSSTLAWKIPWMEEPGRLQSMGSLSRTRLSDFTFTFQFHALEKEMATHSSVLAWRIPGTGEPGGLPSTGSHRVGHD